MPKINYKELQTTLLANAVSYLSEWLEDGKIEGDEFTALNPTRSDSTLGSFRINIKKGIWFDFATNEKGGDLVDLYAYINGLTNGEAAKKLIKEYSLDTVAKAPKVKMGNTTADDGLKLVQPIPDNAPSPPTAIFLNKELGTCEPSRIYEYRNSGKQTVFYVYRFDTADYPQLAKKEIRPVSLWQDKDGKMMWKHKALPNNRSLYNLEMLASYPQKPVLMVSGEKCVDAVKYSFGKKFGNEAMWPFVPITWSFGDNGIGKADFRPLQNREMLYWPDNDDSSRVAMKSINLTYPGKTLYIDNGEKGWDVADLITENLENKEFDLAKYIREALEAQNEGETKLDEPAPKSIFPNISIKGGVQYSIENVAAMMNHYKLKVCYNVISKKLEISINGKIQNRLDAKNDLITRLESLCSINTMARGNVKNAMNYIANMSSVNPVLNWICSNLTHI